MKIKVVKFAKYLPLVLGALLIFSCKNNEKKKIDGDESKADVRIEQAYTMDDSGVVVGWTAYKFTERAGVKGVFDAYTLSPQEDAESVEALLKDAKISINTSSVNSGLKERDDKLQTYFFKVFHTDTIKGDILSALDGKGTLEVQMNGIKNKVDYTYTFELDTLALSTSLDLVQWKGEKAVKTLNKECYLLHTGADGVSKLWPDILVNIKIPIKEIALK